MRLYPLYRDFHFNTFMKKYLLLLIFLSGTLCVYSMYAWSGCTISSGTTAVGLLTGCGDLTTVWVRPGGWDAKWDVQKRIQDIASVAISFWALLAVGALVWSGIQYTKAYGEDEKLKKAKTTAIYSIIGLVLLMASFGLIDIFMNFLYKVSAG